MDGSGLFELYRLSRWSKRIVSCRFDEKGESRLFKRVLKGMLPKNKLGAQLLRNVYIYGGSEHPHAAQTPKTIDINTLK